MIIAGHYWLTAMLSRYKSMYFLPCVMVFSFPSNKVPAHSVGSFSCPLCPVVLLTVLHCDYLNCNLGKNDEVLPIKGLNVGLGAGQLLNYQISVPVKRILQHELLSSC